ncbi:MAG: 4a-hydroxytetrahydrobiopterin dehydratase [Nitriliruptorales bacterium]|nr:4a-hydroxytetrahydrobiopterin dehydratase [Nitriliruptorales bacterium]
MTDELNPDALHKALNELNGWSGTKDGIHKTYRFTDADLARAFVDRVSTLADQMNHHPDVSVDGGTVELLLVTHSAGGVTQKDLDLATRIDTGEAHGDANPDNPAAGRGDA